MLVAGTAIRKDGWAQHGLGQDKCARQGEILERGAIVGCPARINRGVKWSCEIWESGVVVGFISGSSRYRAVVVVCDMFTRGLECLKG